MNEDDDEVVTLAFFNSEIEATLLADELSREGIQAEAAGTLTAGFRAEAPGKVKLLVHANDLARARELMDAYVASRDELDWSQIDVGEPEEADDAAE